MCGNISLLSHSLTRLGDHVRNFSNEPHVATKKTPLLRKLTTHRSCEAACRVHTLIRDVLINKSEVQRSSLLKNSFYIQDLTSIKIWIRYRAAENEGNEISMFVLLLLTKRCSSRVDPFTARTDGGSRPTFVGSLRSTSQSL